MFSTGLTDQRLLINRDHMNLTDVAQMLPNDGFSQKFYSSKDAGNLLVTRTMIVHIDTWVSVVSNQLVQRCRTFASAVR
jgi:hypothetical protein